MSSAEPSTVHLAHSVADAIAALLTLGPAAQVMAGATWVMRGPLRGEPTTPCVAIGGVSTLRALDVAADGITIGACVTHTALARGLSGVAEVGALAQAAAKSANPSVRNVATIGGNLCTVGFAAADLAPALLCLGAEVECVTAIGAKRISLDSFLAMRSMMSPGTLLTRIFVPRVRRRSVHVRLPLRKAGDYPVAIVSIALSQQVDGTLESATVAVGSVEATPRRWASLEHVMIGMPLDPSAIATRATALTDEFTGRDGIEAPGWYRVRVLPALVRRALESLQLTH
jgi:aerobic carbon-monoxide dehydrogenase medium subunit